MPIPYFEFVCEKFAPFIVGLDIITGVCLLFSGLKLDSETLLEIDKSNVSLITPDLGDQLRLLKYIRIEKEKVSVVKVREGGAPRAGFWIWCFRQYKIAKVKFFKSNIVSLDLLL